MDAAGLRGGRRGSGFSPTGGLGEGPLFHQYTKIHTGAGGHKTAVLALTRWVQSASRGLALDSTSALEGSTAWCHKCPGTHTPHTPLTESLLLSVFSFLPQASACLIFRHVQLSGLKDCSATGSIPGGFTIRGQMSGGR